MWNNNNTVLDIQRSTTNQQTFQQNVRLADSSSNGDTSKPPPESSVTDVNEYFGKCFLEKLKHFYSLKFGIYNF